MKCEMRAHECVAPVSLILSRFDVNVLSHSTLVICSFHAINQKQKNILPAKCQVKYIPRFYVRVSHTLRL